MKKILVTGNGPSQSLVKTIRNAIRKTSEYLVPPDTPHYPAYQIKSTESRRKQQRYWIFESRDDDGILIDQFYGRSIKAAYYQIQKPWRYEYKLAGLMTLKEANYEARSI